MFDVVLEVVRFGGGEGWVGGDGGGEYEGWGDQCYVGGRRRGGGGMMAVVVNWNDLVVVEQIWQRRNDIYSAVWGTCRRRDRRTAQLSSLLSVCLLGHR